MGRVILGLLKGGLIGAAIGAGAFKLGIAGGFLALVVYAVIGGVVGMLCGRPPWRQDTFWTTALKGIFGAVIGGALYWGAGKLLGGAHLSFVTKLGAPADRPLIDIPLLLGPAIGAVWGLFVEVDDGGSADKVAAAKSGKPAAPKK